MRFTFLFPAFLYCLAAGTSFAAPPFIKKSLKKASGAISDTTSGALGTISDTTSGALSAITQQIPGTEQNNKLTKIQYAGNHTLSDSYLQQALGGMLEYVENQPIKASRAEDAAFMVQEVYRKAGFNNAAVTWEIVNSTTLLLKIDAGNRELLGEIKIVGTDDTKLEKTLIELFELTPKKRVVAFEEIAIRDSDTDAGIDLMTAQLRSLGYYDARIELVDAKTHPQNNKKDFSFRLTQGKQFTIAQPTFNEPISDALAAQINAYTGLPATAENLNKLRTTVIESYQSRGFLSPKISVQNDVLNTKILPRYEVTPGKRIILRDIRISGLEKTNPERIISRLEDLKGRAIDGPRVRKRLGQIIGTGAFSGFRNDLEPVDDTFADAHIHVTEGKARGISFSAGMDTFDGPIFGSNYYDHNYHGQIRDLNAGFEISARTLLGEVSLADPWIFGSDLSGWVRAFALNRKLLGYSIFRTGFEAGIKWPVSRRYSLELSANSTFNTTSTDGLLASEIGTPDYQIMAIRLSQLLDYRDNAVAPTKGWHIEVPVEIGSAIGSDTTPFFIAGFDSSYRHSLGKNGLLALGLRSHALIPGNDQRLPIDLRLFTGGSRSVRSFRERELGPWSITGYPVGGQALWVANAEYIHQIAGPLKGVAFIDAGSLSRNWRDLTNEDVKVAVGMGLRLDLPIGPIRFEYGHNLTREGHDPSGTFHFAIGITF